MSKGTPGGSSGGEGGGGGPSGSRGGSAGGGGGRGGSWSSRDGGIHRESVNVREGILYALVARHTAVLAKYGRCAGNFTEVSELVLAKISPVNPKLTYEHGRFYKYYGSLGLTAMPYSMNTEFGAVLHTQMKRFSEPDRISSGGGDRLMQVVQQTEEVKEIMVHNIESITNRGENMELLVEKTMELSYDAVNFDHRSKTLKKRMLHKNIKISIVLALILLVVVYFILALICGFDFQHCR